MTPDQVKPATESEDANVLWLLWLADDISQRSGWSLEVPQRLRLIADRVAVALNPERYRCDPVPEDDR